MVTLTLINIISKEKVEKIEEKNSMTLSSLSLIL